MSYHHPAPGEEAWRRTRPKLFSFPKTVVADSVAKFTAAGKEKAGVHILQLEQARKKFPHIIEGCERTDFDNDFSRYAAEQAREGFFIYVESKNPVSLSLFLYMELAYGKSAALKNLIVVAPRTDVSLIEQIDDPGGKQLLSSTQVILGAEARFAYKRLWHWNRRVYAETKFLLSGNARLELNTFTTGSGVGKIEQEVDLHEMGSSVDELFVDLARENAHFDFTSNILHNAPYTTSRLEARSVVRDSAYSLHHGLITIAKDARGADSYFSSRNLLLSSEGRADAIPKLEIATDEVKAGHGATVSDIDPEAIYYLMSRGLPCEKAEDMLVEGFLSKLYERFPELENLREKSHVA